MSRLLLIFSIIISMNSISFADAEKYDVLPDDFKSEQERQRYKYLVELVRCTVCQNQNVADSNADLARELRLLILEKIQKGESDDEILDFLVARYGEFILYRPQFSIKNIFIWFGPFIILFAAFYYFTKFTRAVKKSPSIFSDEEQKILEDSLKELTQTNNKDRD